MQVFFQNVKLIKIRMVCKLICKPHGLLILFFLLPASKTAVAANRTWSGATSTAWAVASNWVGNNPPGNGDNVFIPGGLTNYPVTTTNINIKTVTINSAGSGGRLTIASGIFNPTVVTVNATGLLIFNAGVMNASGLTVSGTFNMTGGTVESSDLLLVNNGGVVNQSGGSIIMNGNAAANPNDNVQVNAGGVINQSSGTLFLKDLLPGAGTINQTGAGALIKLRRNWSFGAGSIFNATAGTLQFTGNATLSNFSAGTRQFSNVIIDAAMNPGFSLVSSSVIPVNGNFTNNNAALANTANATFIFNGSANQTIFSATAGITATFGNLVINKPGGIVSLLSNCYSSGNLTVTSGSFDLVTYISNRSTAGGTLTVSAGAFMRLGGITGGQAGSNFPINFTTITLASASTIQYDGANQVIASFNYGNLTLSGKTGAVVKSFPVTALSVAGNLTTAVGSAVSVTCNAAAIINISGNLSIGPNTAVNGIAFTHTIFGNFIDNGTYNCTGITILKGNLSGSGIFNGADATLEMSGVTLQTIAGGVFSGNNLKNLTVNNSSGVLLTGNLNVTAIVKVMQGDFNSGGFLTLVSTATQSALIDGSGSGSVSGNVTMQRFLPSGFGYKYFSSPFQAATVNEFSDDLNLLATFPPFYRYNESLLSSGWVNYSSPSGLLLPLSGYAANFGAGVAPITVDITGSVNNTPLLVSLFNTNKPFTTGFNLVGNPYPSPVDWNAAAGWNRLNIDNAIYYFDAGSSDQYGGTYSSYINGISSNGIAGSLIPAMQGFFVHVSDGAYPVAGTLQINNAARTTDLLPVFHRIALSEDRPILRIEAGFSDIQTTKDAMVLYFDEMATAAFDNAGDALKIWNTDAEAPSVYSISSDKSKLSINALPYSKSDFFTLPSETIEIPLGIRMERNGQVVFNNTSMERIPDSVYIYFSDSEKRINQDLRINPEYRIDLDQGTYENRFKLIISSSALPYVTDTDEFGVYSSGSTIFIYVNPEDGENGTLVISNMQGKEMYSQLYSSDGYHTLTPGFADGIYVASFYTGAKSFSKKLFLRNE